LRVKIDETTLILNWVQQVENVAVKDGALRDCEMLAIIEIPSVYFFRDQYGLTIKATQIRYKYDPRKAEEPKFLFTGIV